MPQLDSFIIFDQIFLTFLSFWFLYFVLLLSVLPNLLKFNLIFFFYPLLFFFFGLGFLDRFLFAIGLTLRLPSISFL